MSIGKIVFFQAPPSTVKKRIKNRNWKKLRKYIKRPRSDPKLSSGIIMTVN